ncbi:sulfotransferase family 2 domain-containing protein [Bacillus gaemokensis]|uniref:RNA methyltransferase n=1 Tax=Bacillus gaemokensis TaxID=574375 RepID=A0A073KKB7_9BACI|nr:sulfotransferase family 2 domain-containing protein [Bacillus gaemokensis]KEK22788.1 RNA methyltransferase [Bacillus gaemokensis]KYG36821.1 RNA methyltransferase [Bacillus gaemokensis]
MTNEDLEKVLVHGSRAPHFHKDFPLILFWSQKSGCTSFAHWFFFQIGLLNEAIQYHSFIHTYEYEVYKNKIEYLLELTEEIRNGQKDTVKLVRNPYKRAVSSFLTLLKQRPHWNHLREIIFPTNNKNQRVTFKRFLYYIQKVGAHSAILDPHFSQQYIQNEEHIIDNYIQLENYENEIKHIENKYNLRPSPLSELIESPHHHAPTMTYTGNYADFDITNPDFPKFPTYQSFYDEETLELVTEIFKKDIEMYNYPKGIL